MAQLKLVKSASMATFTAPGQLITYSYKVTNMGTWISRR